MCIYKTSGGSGLDEARGEIGAIGRTNPLPDLAREGAGKLRVAILRSNLDVFAQKIDDGD